MKWTLCTVYQSQGVFCHRETGLYIILGRELGPSGISLTKALSENMLSHY